MKAVEATMTSKGQVTVPAALRKALSLKPGDRLIFSQDEAGTITVEARTEALADLRGIVGRGDGEPVGPVDGARIAAWIEEGHIARWRRTRASKDDA